MSILAIVIIQLVLALSEKVDHIKLLEEKHGRVIQVLAIFRHGQRAPLNSYPRDPYSNYQWPDGRGNLLKTGKQKLYNEGEWFRKHYKKLIEAVNTHTDIQAFSSVKDRAIMSGQCFLASFYVPMEHEMPVKHLKWIGIPIHSSSSPYNDPLTRMRRCKAFINHMNEYYRSKKAEKVYNDYQSTIRVLENNSGLAFPKNNLYQCRVRISSLADPLNIQNSCNFTLPSWTKKVLPQPLNNLKIAFVSGELNKFGVRKLTAGPLLEPVLANMIDKSENKSSVKFHFYFGGDTHVVWTLNGLRIFDNEWPPFGSSIIFELREKGDNHFVTILYKNSTTAAPAELIPPRCKKTKVCTLKMFSRIVERLVPKNLTAECELERKTTGDGNFSNLKTFGDEYRLLDT